MLAPERVRADFHHVAALWNEAGAGGQRYLLESLMGQGAEKAELLGAAAQGEADRRDRVETLAEALHDLARTLGQARDEVVLAAAAAEVVDRNLARWCHESVRVLQVEVEGYRASTIRSSEPGGGPEVDR